MQVDITPDLIVALSTLVKALEHNPTGSAYLVTLTALVVMAFSGRTK